MTSLVDVFFGIFLDQVKYESNQQQRGYIKFSYLLCFCTILQKEAFGHLVHLTT